MKDKRLKRVLHYVNTLKISVEKAIRMVERDEFYERYGDNKTSKKEEF